MKASHFPELGQLEVIEVYTYYDEPVLFAARNERDGLFLAALSKDTNEDRIWTYAPMSERRFQEVRSGGIDLNQAFKEVEGGFLYLVTLPKREASQGSGKWVIASQLAEDELPKAGDCLDLNTVTLPMHAVPDVVRQAHQARKEVLALRFEFAGMRRTEAPAGLIGQVLDTLQQLVLAVGQAKEGKGTSRGSFPKELVDQMALSLTGVFAGSFGVELHANASADLFGASHIREALSEVFRLIEVSEADEQLLASLNELKGRTTQKYKQFLSRFPGAIQKVDVHWGSPQDERSRVVTMTTEAAAHALEAISRLEPSAPLEYDVLARLVGINVRTKTYEIWDVNENRKFSGKILDEAAPNVEHATVNNIYAATIREESEVTATGEPETKYRLLRLSVDEGQQTRSD